MTTKSELEGLALIRKSMAQHAANQLEWASRAAPQSEVPKVLDMKRQVEEVKNTTDKWIEENKPELVKAIAKRKDWDDMTERDHNMLIELWKKEHPKWSDKSYVYSNLISNKYGTDWRYINNVLASVMGVTQPPQPGTVLGGDDGFYSVSFPTAATIVWWAKLYGVSLVANPVWYNRVYVTRVDQVAVLQGREIINDTTDALSSPSSFMTGIKVMAALVAVAFVAKSYI